MSATLLGERDFELLSPPEMARKTGHAASVPNFAIISDADTGGHGPPLLSPWAPCLHMEAGCHVSCCATGGGNALIVQRTVRQLISAGAKGCVLEDQTWPKKTGQMRNKSVISMEEFVAKLSCCARFFERQQQHQLVRLYASRVHPHVA